MVGHSEGSQAHCTVPNCAGPLKRHAGGLTSQRSIDSDKEVSIMRRFAQFLLISCFLAIPGIAQRGGGGFHGGGGGFHGGMGGFHGGGFVRPGFRGGSWRGYRGGYYPGNRFGFGFRFSGYWPYYGSGWGYPYYGYPYYPYTAFSYAVPYSYPYYGYSYVYTGSDQPYCPQ